MGIRGLNAFIKKICPESITLNKINKYSGKVFGIDASILLYKYRHISNLDTNCVNSHIIGFLNRIIYYKNNNITPIFIFDGTPTQGGIIIFINELIVYALVMWRYRKREVLF